MYCIVEVVTRTNLSHSVYICGEIHVPFAAILLQPVARCGIIIPIIIKPFYNRRSVENAGVRCFVTVDTTPTYNASRNLILMYTDRYVQYCRHLSFAGNSRHTPVCTCDIYQSVITDERNRSHDMPYRCALNVKIE